MLPTVSSDMLRGSRGGGAPRRRLHGKQNVWSSVDAHLVQCGLQRISVPADAIVPSLIVSFALHYLREHINTFASFFTEDEDINAYLTAMALPGTWGDSLVLTAAAVLLQAPIHVAQSLVYI